MTAILSVGITTAVTAQTGSTFKVRRPMGQDAVGLTMKAVFTYGSSGTNATAYVQTSFDAGTTWVDIACFQFLTTTATKLCNLRSNTPVTTLATGTDGSLTANTTVDGLIGDRIRVKYTTTGTYGGSTTLAISVLGDIIPD